MTPPPDPTTESDRDAITDLIMRRYSTRMAPNRSDYTTADAILALLAQRGRLVGEPIMAHVQADHMDTRTSFACVEAVKAAFAALESAPPPRVPGEG